MTSPKRKVVRKKPSAKARRPARSLLPKVTTTLPSNLYQLARIRHELRTPINHILGYSEMLEEDLLDSGQKRMLVDLKRIQGAGRQLLDLVNELFGSNEGVARKVDLRKSLHNLRTPVNHVVGYSEILEEDAATSGLPNLIPDLQKIGQAGRNLLSMVEHYLVHPASVGASAAGSKQAGSGMPPPVKKNPAAPVPRPARKNATILVVDDDANNRQILSRLLQRQGYKALTAENGPAALTLIRAGGLDLILLDVIMPGMTGPEVLDELKSDEQLRHIPVIMLSAMDMLDSVVECIERGAEDYVTKPFNPVFLKARIGAALEKKELRDQEQIYLQRIQQEQEKSDRLLLNVLPAAIANRLKSGDTSIVDSFPEATVIFADVVRFTALCVHVSPAEVVRLLDELFSAFDLLATRYGLEKIKTIGDAYMAASGLPVPRKDHAEAAAEFCLDLLKEIEQFNRKYDTSLHIRVGMNSGPVIAGIIGRSKFIYDLWGDTVNTANRMEAHGVAGRIQVSEGTYEILRKNYLLEKRGLIEVKGKGEMETYFLNARIHKKPLGLQQ